MTMKNAARQLTENTVTYGLAFDSESSMTCVCDYGFRGPDCSLRECPSSADPMGGYGHDGQAEDLPSGPALDCSGRGLCNYQTGVCSCAKGFTGEACERQTTFV
jgi:hypothetical protein